MTSWARARAPAGRLCSVPAAPTFPSNIHHRLHRGNRKHPTKPTTTTTTTSTTTPLSVARVPLSSSVSSVVRSLPDDGGIVGCMQQQQPQPPSCRRRRPCSPAVPVPVPRPCVHSPERRTGTGTGGGRPQLPQRYETLCDEPISPAVDLHNPPCPGYCTFPLVYKVPYGPCKTAITGGTTSSSPSRLHSIHPSSTVISECMMPLPARTSTRTPKPSHHHQHPNLRHRHRRPSIKPGHWVMLGQRNAECHERPVARPVPCPPPHATVDIHTT